MFPLKIAGCGGSGIKFLNYVKSSIYINGISINDSNSDIIIDRKIVGVYDSMHPSVFVHTFPWLKDVKSSNIIVLSGLGGEIGTNITRIIGRAFHSKSRLIGIFTTPFRTENEIRIKRAEDAINEIDKNYDFYIILSNDALVDYYPNLQINLAMKIQAEVMLHIILDFQRILLKNIMNLKLRGRLGIGIGFGIGKERIKVAIEDALDSPWITDGDKIMLFSGNMDKEDIDIIVKNYEPEFYDLYVTPEYGEQVKVTILSRT